MKTIGTRKCLKGSKTLFQRLLFMGLMTMDVSKMRGEARIAAMLDMLNGKEVANDKRQTDSDAQKRNDGV